MTNDIEILENGDFKVIPLKENKAVVWSKNNCGYCVRAKELLKKHGVDFGERNISEGMWTTQQLLEIAPGVRTMPQIFMDSKHIGGFDDLDAYMFLKYEN